MKRIFIGIEIQQAHEKINKHIEELKNTHNDVKIGWEHSEKLHITLKFLGNITDEQLNLVRNALIKVSSCPSFPINIERTGCFPMPENARILWLGINDPTNILKKLYADIEREFELIGFAKEKRGFTPHLTIARLKHQDVKSKKLVDDHMQKNFERIDLHVSKISIYESVLRPSGSAYSVINTIALK